MLAVKGITVRLGHDACILFDTDLMRVAAGWTGGFLDLSKTNLGGLKGDFPAAVQGKLQFVTGEAPGWAKGETFDDPRPSHQGPLPKDWAHYRGLYRNGEKVIFSYDVGGVGVLDMPGAFKVGQQTVFTRTLRIEPSDKPMRLFNFDSAKLSGVGMGMTVLKPGGPVSVDVMSFEDPLPTLILLTGRKEFRYRNRARITWVSTSNLTPPR